MVSYLVRRLPGRHSRPLVGVGLNLSLPVSLDISSGLSLPILLPVWHLIGPRATCFAGHLVRRLVACATGRLIGRLVGVVGRLVGDRVAFDSGHRNLMPAHLFLLSVLLSSVFSFNLFAF